LFLKKVFPGKLTNYPLLRNAYLRRNLLGDEGFDHVALLDIVEVEPVCRRERGVPSGSLQAKS
jgi:hypothetical protein